MSQQHVCWTTDRLGPALGAKVHGLDATDLLSSDTIDALHVSLMEHQVLVLEGVDLTPTQLAALGRHLGPLAARHHSYRTHPESDDVVVLDWSGDQTPDAAEWHADMTYRENPPFASVLQAVQVPLLGGDTLWASMYSVLDSLPPGLRSELADMQAVHDMGAFRTTAFAAAGHTGLQEALATTGSAVHPIIAQHPVTERSYLNVSESFTRFVIGLSAPESARLLTMLFDAINRPQHHIRLRWRPGTIAIWDNRSTQHYALADYLPQRRVMYRVAVERDERTPEGSSSSED